MSSTASSITSIRRASAPGFIELFEALLHIREEATRIRPVTLDTAVGRLGIDKLYFMRFHHVMGSAEYEMNKMLNLTGMAVPRGVTLLQSIQTTQPNPRWHWWLQGMIHGRAERIVVPSSAGATTLDGTGTAARARLTGPSPP